MSRNRPSNVGVLVVVVFTRERPDSRITVVFPFCSSSVPWEGPEVMFTVRTDETGES